MEEVGDFFEVVTDPSSINEFVEEGAPSPEDLFFEAEQRALVSRALRTLEPRYEEVLRRRFGIGRDQQTLTQIGTGYGRSKTRMKQIENAGIYALRKRIRWHALSELSPSPVKVRCVGDKRWSFIRRHAARLSPIQKAFRANAMRQADFRKRLVGAVKDRSRTLAWSRGGHACDKPDE